MSISRAWPSLIACLAIACGPQKQANHEVEPAPIVIVAAPSTSDERESSIATHEEAPKPALREMTLLEDSLAEIFNGWTKESHCPDFDYFPDGGYQNFWCHRPDVLTPAFLESHAHARMFVSGPHANGFVSNAKNDFGHYNPVFVRWLADDAAPKGRDTVFRATTQATFDADMRPLAKIFYWTRQKTIADQACFQHEKDTYEKLVAKKSLPPGYQERWFWFMNPYFCPRMMKGQTGDQFFYSNGFDAGFEGNVGKTAVGFWIRRSLDGTIDDFSRALDKLVAAYMPELVTGRKKFPDGATIDSALTTGERSAAVCKDPAGRATTINVEVVLAPNGEVQADVHPGRNRVASSQIECIREKFGALTIPAFDGEPLKIERTLTFH